jgi:CSLREA domain-containing protein
MMSIVFRTLRLGVLLLTVFLFSTPFASPAPVHAADFTVDTLTDEADGSCSDDDCSLRDAMALADANGVPDTIAFSVAGTITLESGLGDLPALTDSGTTIDGTTAPDYSGTPVVAISGDSALGTGLRIASFQNTVKGLHIHSFTNECIWIDSGSGNIVGPNMVMSNCAFGTMITGASEQNSIEDSFIGTDETGMSAWGNILGVVFYNEDGQPGPTVNDLVGNVISGNTIWGIWLGGDSTYENEIKGNYIGVAADGVTPLGNGGAGIWIGDDSFENYIGGAGPGEGNIIAYNASEIPDTGIVIIGDDTDSNKISRNSIYDNVDLGIDLGDDGVTCAGEGDGPNDLIHCPVITSATTTLVSGTACLECTVEVFIADPDPSGYGEGRTFVGDADTDESGDFAVSVTGVDDCDWLTATAIGYGEGNYGNTSEFALNVQVPCPPPEQHRRATRTPTPAPTDTPAPTETPLPPTPTLAPPPVPTATPFGGVGPAVLPPSTGDGAARDGSSWLNLALLLAAAGSVLTVGGFWVAKSWRRDGG